MLTHDLYASMISQQSSWGALNITSEAARKLFSSLTVFPEFLTILNTFGQRTCLQSDSHGSFRTVSHTQPESSGMSSLPNGILYC